MNTFVNFAIKSFKTEFTYILTFVTSGQLCAGLLWQMEPIKFQLTSQMQLMQCYKTVLSTVYDLKDAWEGDSALWLDSCSLPGTANGEAPEIWVMDKIISRGTTYNNGAVSN